MIEVNAEATGDVLVEAAGEPLGAVYAPSKALAGARGSVRPRVVRGGDTSFVDADPGGSGRAA